MVRRWRIRSKLFIAVSLLLATVLLLAFSGFWGLYRYRHLANSLVQRAMEIPYAYDLNRHALTLCEIDTRRSQISAREGMIQSSTLGDPLFDIAKLESERFDNALIDFYLTLQRYESAVADLADLNETPSLLVDLESQQQSLANIRTSFERLEGFLRGPHTVEPSRRLELKSHLSRLVRETDDHLRTIHGGMSAFSRDVRGQYRAWISVAWTSTILAIAMVGMLLLAFRSLVVKPFRTLLDGSRLVAGGQFDHRIDLGTGDELSELANAMNDMTDRFQGALATVKSWCTDLDKQVQERTREVIQNEQLASVGFLAAGVAHEINNPLATIAWSAESLQSRAAEHAMDQQPEDETTQEWFAELSTNLRRIEEEAYRCKGITEKLLDFSRLSEVRRAPTDLTELVRDVVAMVATVGEYRCKTLNITAENAVVAHVNPQEVRQVVLNLVTNALESVDTDGAVDIAVTSDSQKALVVVQDNGCGMNEEVMKHLFEPFFTRRRDGTGTGLGLSITYRIISQHGGSLTPYSEGEGRGSKMELMLPLDPENLDVTAYPQISLASKSQTSHRTKTPNTNAERINPERVNPERLNPERVNPERVNAA